MKHNRNVVILLSLFFFFVVSCSNPTSNQTPTLSVSPTAVSLNAGDPSTTFKATQKNSTDDISWTLSPTVGTLSSTTGVEVSYTPPSTVAAETTVTLTASLGNLTAKATLTITPTNPNPTGFKISGQVQDYDAGAASLEAITFARETKSGTGSIAADGSFSITLAKPADEDLIAAEKPCPEINQRPADFNLTSVVSLKIIKDGLGIGDLFHASSPDFFADNQVSYTYADRDVSVSGSCLLDGTINTFDLSFKQGWNLLLRESSEDAVTFTTPESIDLPWLFSPSFPTGDTPTVVSVDPPDGATGVTSDAIITITFSKAMDTEATQAAYQSADLLPSEVSFFWNDEATVLEIESENFLEYGRGEGTTFPAKQYAFAITDAAKDVDGNPLEPFSSSFSTLRAVSNSCLGIPDLEGQVHSNGSLALNGSVIEVGDYSDNSGVRGFFSFDLSPCLPPDDQSLSRAELNLYQFSTENTPDELGSVSIEHLDFGDILAADDYAAPALTTVGIFEASSLSDRTWLTRDVTTQILDDIANFDSRGGRSQFRLSFASQSDNNNDFDVLNFIATTSEGSSLEPFINLEYLIP